MRHLVNTESYYIRKINVLSVYEQSEHAMYLIRKVASLVLPIMKRRSYIVGTLTEFYDRPPDWERRGVTLGWNRNNGEVIALRLREAQNPTVFLQLESIIQTMLHELCHNVWNNHDDNFYALLKEHEWEYEQLTLSGFTGDQNTLRGAPHYPETLGSDSEPNHSSTPLVIPEPPAFTGDGKSLGGRLVPNRDEARRLALAAAENRKRIQEEERKRKARARKEAMTSYQMPIGTRLGGKVSEIPIRLAGKAVQTSDREKIAAAAERRRHDAITCGSGATNTGPRRQQLENTVDNGIRTGIQVEPDPISADEMAAILLQIQMLEEAEQLRNQNMHSATYPPLNNQITEPKINSSDSDCNSKNNKNNSNTRNTPISSAFASGSQLASEPPSQRSKAPSKSLSEDAPLTKSLPIRITRNPSSAASRPTNTSAPLWSCPACTLINAANVSHCSVCETPRAVIITSGSEDKNSSSFTGAPTTIKKTGTVAGATTSATPTTPTTTIINGKKMADADQWQCHRCKTLIDIEWWTCTKCGVIKLTS